MPTLTWDDLAAIRTEVATVKRPRPPCDRACRSSARTRTGRRASRARPPNTSTFETGPSHPGPPSRRRTWRRARRSSFSARPSSKSSTARTPTRSGRWSASGRMPFLIVGVAARKGPVGHGQDYDDAAFIPYTTFAQKSRAAEVPAGVDHGRGRRRPMRRRERRRTSRRSCETATTLAASDDDDFRIRNLSEIAARSSRGRRHDDDASSRASPPSRSSSAASAS